MNASAPKSAHIQAYNLATEIMGLDIDQYEAIYALYRRLLLYRKPDDYILSTIQDLGPYGTSRLGALIRKQICERLTSRFDFHYGQQ